MVLHELEPARLRRHTHRNKSSIVGPLQCPKCSALLSCSHRYGSKQKEALFHVDGVKAKVKASGTDQSSLPADMRENLRRICRISIIAYSDLHQSIKEFLLRPIKSLLNAVKKLQAGQPVSRDEGFLLLLLAKVVQFVISTTRSPLIYQSMLSNLTRLLSGLTVQLSFQTVHDLTSEVYRLCAITKTALSHQGASLSGDPILLKNCEHPHRRMSRDDFLLLSNFLDPRLPRLGKVTAVKPNILDTSAEFVSDIEKFYPTILRGCWMKCSRDHYYCIPVCEPNTLKVQCPECIGKHFVV